MKKRYVISSSGLFEFGYVRSNWSGFAGKTVYYKSIGEARRDATKMRFKWIANLWCWILNKESRRNYDFRIFKVETYPGCCGRCIDGLDACSE